MVVVMAAVEVLKTPLVMALQQLQAVQLILAVVAVEILHLFTTVAQHKLALVLVLVVQV